MSDRLPFAIWGANVSPGARYVFIALRSFCHNDRSECWPSEGRLVHMTGYSLRSVRNFIHELRDAGFLTIRVERTDKGARNVYDLSTSRNYEEPTFDPEGTGSYYTKRWSKPPTRQRKSLPLPEETVTSTTGNDYLRERKLLPPGEETISSEVGIEVAKRTLVTEDGQGSSSEAASLAESKLPHSDDSEEDQDHLESPRWESRFPRLEEKVGKETPTPAPIAAPSPYKPSQNGTKKDASLPEGYIETRQNGKLYIVPEDKYAQLGPTPAYGTSEYIKWAYDFKSMARDDI